MNSNSILLIDPEFDPSTASDCNLLIKVGVDSFSYAIINNAQNKVIAVFDEQECNDVAQKFAIKLKTDYYLTLNYHSVKIAVYTPNVITIPNALYVEDDIASYTQFFGDSNFGNVYVQPENDFRTLFAFNSEVDELINAHFPLAKKYHVNICLLPQDGTTMQQFAIDFTVSAFNMVYRKNGQLIFQQTYEVASAEEFNYYLLLLINQLNIKLDQIELNLTGIINQDDDKHNTAKQYFNKVQFKEAAFGLQQEVLEDMPPHYYTSLLALNECE